MYFRLCNSPETFQRMMNSIFQELLHEGLLANYMDNFIILAKNMKELEERTIQFLKIAEKHVIINASRIHHGNGQRV